MLGESKRGPFILFVKDLEKSIAGNFEVCNALKMKLENLPANVVVIGSHTRMDDRKEKVRTCQCTLPCHRPNDFS